MLRVFVLLVLGSVAALAASCGDEEERVPTGGATPPMASPSLNDAPARSGLAESPPSTEFREWRFWSDAELKFTVGYPDDWYLVAPENPAENQGDGRSIRIMNYDPDGSRPNDGSAINVNALVMKVDNRTAEQYLAELEANSVCKTVSAPAPVRLIASVSASARDFTISGGGASFCPDKDVVIRNYAATVGDRILAVSVWPADAVDDARVTRILDSMSAEP